MYRAKSLYLLICSMLVSAYPAFAQDKEADDDSFFLRDRNVSVKDRPKPGYETSGIQSGVFIIRPELNLQVEADDNIFAGDIDEESDIITAIMPSVDIQTTFSRHAILGTLGIEHREYIDFTNESVTNFNSGVTGRLDVDRGTYIEVGADYKIGHETRTEAVTANGSESPLKYDITTFSTTAVREQGRTKFEAGGSYNSYDFKDADIITGGIIDQDFRDLDAIRLILRGDYAISPDTSIFIRAFYEDEEFKIEQPDDLNRDQDGYTIDVGADFDITNTIRGEIGVGFLRRSFAAPLLEDIEAFSYSGQVEWFATPLITVSADAGRTVRPSGLLSAPALTENRFGVSADYEWRRNIIVSTGYNFVDEKYRGIDRDDRRISYFLGAEYLMNRYVRFGVRFSRDTLDSDGADNQFDFNSNRLLFGVRLRR